MLPFAGSLGLLVAIQQPFFTPGHLVCLLLSLLIAFLLFNLLAISYGTAYDAEFFYLLRHTGTEAIALACVFKIKLHWTRNNTWGISYRGANNQPQTVNVSPRSWHLLGSRISGFHQAVQMRNPQVIIDRGLLPILE